MRESIDILSRLIAFPTISRNTNLPLIYWLQERLSDKGIESWLSFDDTKTKANLFATIGPETKGGLLISGHTDVVPVDGQIWASDPFQASIRDGKLYGRGSCDMKGFIAATMFCVENLDIKALKKPIHLAFTYDEEVGCKGVRTLLTAMKERDLTPAMCVVGEPTSMRIVQSHKGSRNYRCCVKGKAAHASMANEGVNAIHYAASVISKIEELADTLQTQKFPETGYDTPYDMLQTSLIEGGMARNIVPSQCNFTFGYRYLPQSDPDKIFSQIEDFGTNSVLPRMRAKSQDTDLQFEKLSDNPALHAQSNSEFAALLSHRRGAQGIGPHVGFMTEGGIYQQAGITTVICGPGSIEQAHKPDEFLELSQMSLCTDFLADLFQHHSS
ncbi:acetylornithine deacetylase [Ottowia thiooxydans]|uniref:acetylornithine deacetylase n=1 Tax=Ottowia thiooxydans TaxID=219182 RepID=UPI00041709C2|nr:acetylornithine deacetylase [Ottowia thiooxydans]